MPSDILAFLDPYYAPAYLRGMFGFVHAARHHPRILPWSKNPALIRSAVCQVASMCGINGFSWTDEVTVRRMNQAIAHRGPDNDGVYTDAKVSLGNRRLAIIDLSENGNQPMSNEDGTIWITFNGEIYNFKQLRAQLLQKGHIFKSHSDVETIIHLYEEEGLDCVQSLRGMFAFCIYDSTRQLLFLARDRIGIKPLYYRFEDGRFIFSSEIRGIHQHRMPREVDDGIVFDYLFYGRVDHCERTFYKGILRVPPAHKVVYDLARGELQLTQYWDIDLQRQSRPSLGDAKGRLLSLLKEVVEMHMVADVSIGTSLSGGLDSSTIVSLINHIDLGNFSSYSAIYPGLDIDESRCIFELARELHLDARTVIPDVAELIKRSEEFMAAQEEPVASSSPFAQFEVMELAKKYGTKVLLDGQGGDELFGGYPHYLSSIFLEDLHNGRLVSLAKKVRKYGLSPLLVSLTPVRLKKWALGKNLFGIATRFQIGLGLNGRFLRSHSHESRVQIDIPPTLAEACYRDLTVGLQSLLRYEDKNSMHFSVEARVPFLDHELVEFAFSLPPEYKYGGEGETKFILRETMKNKLPRSIIERKKLGFPTPQDEWIRSEPMVGYVRSILESESFKNRPYFDWAQCLDLFERHIKQEISIGSVIWRWINLESWLRASIDPQLKVELRAS